MTIDPAAFAGDGTVRNGVSTEAAREYAPLVTVPKNLLHVSKIIGDRIKISRQCAAGMCIVLGGLLFAPSIQAMEAIEAHIASMDRDEDCRIIQTTGINFGNYNPLLANQQLTEGSITVRCRDDKKSGPVKIIITMSAGNSGNALDRSMRLGNTDLKYNLYCDETRQSIWGDGKTTQGCSTPINPNEDNVVRVYGKISSTGQNVRAGAYTDNLNVSTGDCDND
jgi:spore coat protein U-like protein